MKLHLIIKDRYQEGVLNHLFCHIKDIFFSIGSKILYLNSNTSEMGYEHKIVAQLIHAYEFSIENENDEDDIDDFNEQMEALLKKEE